MDRKNALRLSFGLVIILASFPLVVQGAEQDQAQSKSKTAQTETRSTHTTERSPLPMTPEERDAQRTVAGPYRITYTITELDGARRIGSQHCAIVLDAGSEHPQSHLKIGSKIPTYADGSKLSTYIDIGLGIRANLLKVANGLELTTQIDQTSIASQDSPTTKDEPPVVRTVTFYSSVLLQEGRTVTLGTASMPGTIHALQIQVELTKIQ